VSGKADLIEAEIPALRRYAYGLTGNAPDSDDLVQDTLERALSRWSQRKPGGSLKAWLFTIQHNLFVNNYRRQKRRGVHTDIDGANEPHSQAADQEAHMELAGVLRAVGQLEDDRRGAILLVAVEDLTYQEAATVLGVPIGTVMSRLSRARRDLRELLDRKSAPALRRVK